MHGTRTEGHSHGTRTVRYSHGTVLARLISATEAYLEYFLNPAVSIAVIEVSRTTHEFLSPYNSLVLMLASLDAVNRGKKEEHPY